MLVAKESSRNGPKSGKPPKGGPGGLEAVINFRAAGVARENRARRSRARRLWPVTVEGENEVWPDLPPNPQGWGPFSPFLCRSSLADTRYNSLLAPRTEKNGLPAPV